MSSLPLIETPPRQPFGELTETPTPTSAPGTRLPYGPSVIFQQFSLKSRWAEPYAREAVPRQPGNTCLRAPTSVTSDIPHAWVKLCRCSWEGNLKRGQPRLCARETNEHDEYFLLDKMCLQFETERAADENLARPVAGAITAAATGRPVAHLRRLEVLFIVEPLEELVVGYVAFKRGAGSFTEAATPQGCSRQGRTNSRDFAGASEEAELDSENGDSPVASEVSTLVQIYVVPEHRRLGFATTALGLLLAGRNSIVVENPTSTLEMQLLTLGFTQSAQRRPWLDSGTGDEQRVRRTLYTRRELRVSDSIENMDNI